MSKTTANIRVERQINPYGLRILYYSSSGSGDWSFCCSRKSVEKIAETLKGELQLKSRPKNGYRMLCVFEFRSFRFRLSPVEARMLLKAINEQLPFYHGP